MSTDGWTRIEELFQQAAELPSSERGPFLDANTDGDPALRREVESLLSADEATEQFMEKPAIPSRLSDLLSARTRLPSRATSGPTGSFGSSARAA